MRKVRLAILLGLGLVLCCSGGSGGSGGGAVKTQALIKVPLKKQKRNLWCWAACAQMIMEYRGAGVDVSQCKQAQDAFELASCCPNGTQSDCNDTWFPDWELYSFNFDERSTPLTWTSVQSQIDNDKPFAFTHEYDGWGSHMMVVVGWGNRDGKKVVFLNDPSTSKPGVENQKVNNVIMNYTLYANGDAHTSHGYTDYNISKLP